MANIEHWPEGARAWIRWAPGGRIEANTVNPVGGEGIWIEVVPADQLRGAVKALERIADPPMGDDYTAPVEYAEWLRDQARRALANLGGQYDATAHDPHTEGPGAPE